MFTHESESICVENGLFMIAGMQSRAM